MATPGPRGGADRPAVSLVVPFKGSAARAAQLGEALGRVRLTAEDEVLVVDNTPDGAASGLARPGLRVVPARLEASSYYARNVGAEHAAHDWLLFVDSDCRPEADLVEAYFSTPPRERDGALAGSVRSVADQRGRFVRFAERFGVVGQEGLQTYLGRPYGLTANLLVRAAAWRDAGGFSERVRSGGDIDFCWRLQELGWTLDGRPAAVVEHSHREHLGEFVRPPVRYGAGLAWLRRRWPQVRNPRTEPAQLARGTLGTVRWLARGRPDEAELRALLALFSAAQAAGSTMSNRPPGRAAPRPARTAACASRFPLDGAAGVAPSPGLGHVEAVGRPLRVQSALIRELDVAFLEDDAPLPRLTSAARLVLRHPSRVARWARSPRARATSLLVAAPAAERLELAGVQSLAALDPGAQPLADALAVLADVRPAA